MNSKHSGGTEQPEASDRGRPENSSQDSKRMSEDGKKDMHTGGDHQGSKTQQPGSAKSQQGSNFANDPNKASEAGRKGGQHSHGSSPGSSAK